MERPRPSTSLRTPSSKVTLWISICISVHIGGQGKWREVEGESFTYFLPLRKTIVKLCIQTNTIWTCDDVWLFNVDKVYLELESGQLILWDDSSYTHRFGDKIYFLPPNTTQQHVFDVCVLKCGSKEKTGVDTCYFQICWRNKKAEGR